MPLIWNWKTEGGLDQIFPAHVKYSVLWPPKVLHADPPKLGGSKGLLWIPPPNSVACGIQGAGCIDREEGIKILLGLKAHCSNSALKGTAKSADSRESWPG